MNWNRFHRAGHLSRALCLSVLIACGGNSSSSTSSTDAGDVFIFDFGNTGDEDLATDLGDEASATDVELDPAVDLQPDMLADLQTDDLSDDVEVDSSLADDVGDLAADAADGDSDQVGDALIDMPDSLTSDTTDEPDVTDDEPDVDLGPPPIPCDTEAQCPVGVACDGEHCTEVECHFGRIGVLPDQPCSDGFVCDVIDPDLVGEPTYSCVAFSADCTLDDTCPFGFRCIELTCQHAPCTAGSIINDWGARVCDEGMTCACMHDGVALNGGRGQCVDVIDEEPDWEGCE